MKTKAIIFAAIICAGITFLSFKAIGERPDTKIATVSMALGKGNNEGYLVTYGDGSTELVQCQFSFTSQEKISNAGFVLTKLMEAMYAKGYHLILTHQAFGAYSPSMLVFEKK